VYSRVANLAFWKPEFEILAFFNTFGFFGNKKKPEKSGFSWLIFNRIGLALAKHCLSCICNANVLRRVSIVMQGAQNIAKNLLLP